MPKPVARMKLWCHGASPDQLAGLSAEDLLDLRKINVATFALADFRRAVDAAAMMQSLDLTAVVP